LNDASDAHATDDAFEMEFAVGGIVEGAITNETDD
jgi:hypothetical protein